ncbi:MAG TPA: PaaI family thioesterase [Actinomycetota bacterium]|nr:PaaI family thioesterase [Actinomycetota bacterium]
MNLPRRAVSAEELNQAATGHLPGLLGIEFLGGEPGRMAARLPIGPDLLAHNGYLHAASIVALADTCAGFGCMVSLPEGRTGFTTVELKTNFTGTTLEGEIRCEARLAHGGRRTQVWDATVSDAATGRDIALFRCTQMLLGG